VSSVLVASILIVVVLGLIVVAVHNSLVEARNHCDEAWSNVDTELRRRYDLIPNLVSAVKGYAVHERSLLEMVARLREEAVANTGSPDSQAVSENKLVRALSQLLVRVESYPELKASRNFLQLQEELSITEDRIQAARRFYNGNVREYNNRVQFFPGSVVASLFKFQPREFFEIEETRQREAPSA